MIWRITGGIWFVLWGLNELIGLGIDGAVLGVLALVAGIALLAGQ